MSLRALLGGGSAMPSVTLTLPHTHNQVTLPTISSTTTNTHIISHSDLQTHSSLIHTHPATHAHRLTLFAKNLVCFTATPAPLLLAEQHMI